MVAAQDMQWQSMGGPYYVYDVTGISLGWYGAQMRAYMVASDLSEKKIYRYQGTSPISEWASGVEMAGAKHISTSKNNAIQAYATVPQDAGDEPGVHYTTNGGLTWEYNMSAQPGNKAFTCIETHPTNPQICFTGGDNNNSYFSSWYTTDGGERWDEIGPSEGIDPRYISNSVRIDPNSGSSWDNTTIYICYGRDQGIWRKFLGGDDNWERIVLFHDIESYNGIDIAIKDDNSNCIYVLAQVDGEYQLWHSDDGGIYWEGYNGDPGPFYNFGTDPVSKVIVYEYLENEVVWVISPNNIYIGVKFPDDHIEWATASGNYQCIASDIGAPYPAGVVYAGLPNAIKQISGNWGTHFDYFSDIDVSKGSNISNIASLHCIVGSPLFALAKEGGYVFHNHQIVQPGDDDNWKTIDWLKGYQIDPNDGDVYGDKIISSYIDYDIGYTTSGHDDSNVYLLEPGQLVNIGTEEPLLIKALAGPLIPNSGHTRPYAGGLNTASQNIVYEIMYTGNDPDYLHTCDNYDSNPPLIEDMINDRSGGYTDYYICGDRTSNQENIVLYVDTWHDPHQFYPLNDGLDGILRAKAIIKAPEIYRTSGDYYPVLYLGTEQGVFKTSFEYQVAMPWRNVSTGIGQGIEIIDLANFGQGFEYTSYKPDSLIEYALGKDASEYPYLYISADSGRSWIENGGYLRDRGLIASSITTISDIRTNFNNPYYLAVGTNRGIHVLPYNVKSGTLNTDEDWGPGLVIVNGDITIPAGVTLTIAAGTTVKFVYGFDRLASGYDANKSEMLVYGTLNLDGEDNNHVVLTSSKPTPAYGDWYGIWVMNNGSLDMKHADLDYAVTAVTAEQGSNTNIRYSQIANCKTAGYYRKGTATSIDSVANSSITNCGSYCASIIGGDPVFINNTLYGATIGYGFKYAGGGSPVISGNIISTSTGAEARSYWGIYISPYQAGDTPKPFLANDSILYFRQGGIYIEGTGDNGEIGPNIRSKHNGSCGLKLVNSSPTVLATGQADHNTFNENGYYGIYCASGSNAKFRWCASKENRYCVYITCNSNPDFGIASDSGFNSFKRLTAPSSTFEMYSLNTGYIQARGNYWGSDTLHTFGNINTTPVLSSDPIPGIEKRRPGTIGMPSELSVANYPNPFNSNTEIRFSLTQSVDVSLRIFDVAGRFVKILADNNFDTGEHSVIWDGTNSSGEKVSSGIYFYSISTAEKAVTKKMVFLK